MRREEVRAHGLDGQLVEPDWPVLKLEEVNQLLRRFPQAERAVRLVSYSPRPFSAASVVETLHGRVFVKRHHGSVRDKNSLREEHGLLEYLAGRTPLVKPPLADVLGDTVITTGKWTYEVHPCGEGLDVYEEAQSWTPYQSVGHAHNAGKALGALHVASAGYDAPSRGPAALVTSFRVFADANPWPQLESYAEERPALHSYLSKRDWIGEARETFEPLQGRLLRHLSVFRPLWTHNDFHSSNLLWSDASPEAEVTDIFDFGLANRSNAIHDIATAVERSVEWLRIHDPSGDPFHWGQIEAFLKGYEEIQPLLREEAAALPALLPLVHAEFALSEADYFIRVLKSEEKTDLAYVGYFLGHARWFSSDSGKRLIRGLQVWSELHPSSELRDSAAHSAVAAPIALRETGK